MIKLFSELNRKDTSIAGGKGASLGELIQVGILVPDGFVVLSEVFEKFLEETDLNVEIDAILKTVEVDKIHTIEHASEKIQALIINVDIPQDIAELIMQYFENLDSQYVAVRSSATAEDSLEAAWAGQLESYLNATKDNLLDRVKKCWASLFTPRAIFYRFEKNLHQTKVSMAVVVQKMIQSEVSGICFTVHPVTEDKNQLVIEAGYGLGEAIVGGMITPDTYVINKTENVIEDKNISKQEMMIVKTAKGTKEVKVPKDIFSKQKISDEKILELTQLAVSIEKHYEKSQDIEWAIEKGKIYIVQSRPITTL